MNRNNDEDEDNNLLYGSTTEQSIRTSDLLFLLDQAITPNPGGLFQGDDADADIEQLIALMQKTAIQDKKPQDTLETSRKPKNQDLKSRRHHMFLQKKQMCENDMDKWLGSKIKQSKETIKQDLNNKISQLPLEEKESEALRTNIFHEATKQLQTLANSFTQEWEPKIDRVFNKLQQEINQLHDTQLKQIEQGESTKEINTPVTDQLFTDLKQNMAASWNLKLKQCITLLESLIKGPSGNEKISTDRMEIDTLISTSCIDDTAETTAPSAGMRSR